MKDIKAGDRVIVTKLTPCCKASDCVGNILKVKAIGPAPSDWSCRICGWCCAGVIMVFDADKYGGQPITRVEKLLDFPLSELLTAEEDIPLRV